MIKGIQVLGMLVGIYLLFQTLYNYRTGNYGKFRMFFFIILWSTMIVLFLNPMLFTLALPFLTTQDMLMSVIVIGLLVSFLLISHLSYQISTIEKKLTDLVQNIAITNYFEEMKNRSKKRNEH